MILWKIKQLVLALLFDIYIFLPTLSKDNIIDQQYISKLSCFLALMIGIERPWGNLQWMHFHQLGPLGRVGLRVAMSVCVSVILCHRVQFLSRPLMTRSWPLIGQHSFPTIWWWLGCCILQVFALISQLFWYALQDYKIRLHTKKERHGTTIKVAQLF